MALPVCAVVVTHDCGEGVLPTLRSVLPQVGRVLVVDDGSGDSTVQVLAGFGKEAPGSVEILETGSNLGIAHALNVGLRRSAELGYPWALTMDHDSVAAEGMVECLYRAVHRQPDPAKVLIGAPVYIDRGTGVAGRLFRYEGWRKTRLDPVGPGEIVFPTVVIASGSLINVDLFGILGGFDETLFMDYVDHDFCLKGRRAGYRILVCGDAVLRHSVGDAVSRSFFRWSWVSSNHSAARRLSMGRNRMKVIGRYGRELPSYAFWTAMDYGIDIIGILLCEDRKWEKIRMILRGARESFGTGGRPL